MAGEDPSYMFHDLMAISEKYAIKNCEKNIGDLFCLTID